MQPPLESLLVLDAADVGGGFGHFFSYCPDNIRVGETFKYTLDRFTMELKRQLHVLEMQLSDNTWIFTLLSFLLHGKIARGIRCLATQRHRWSVASNTLT